MSNSTSETTKTIDYFSLLPNELVQLVVKHYHDVYRCTPIPILSKRFLPHHQAQIYKIVEIVKLSHFTLFLSTLSSNPSLGRLVKIFKLDLSGDDTASNEAITSVEPSAAIGFRTLVSLQLIKLSGPNRIWKFLLDTPVLISHDLRTVSLSAPSFTHGVDALRRARFANLIRYPKLSSLSISQRPWNTTVSDQSSPDSSSPPDPLDTVQTFPKLKYLCLATDFSRLSEPGDLLESCSPERLVVHDYSPTDSKITDLLETLKKPKKLLVLRIGSIARPPHVPRYFSAFRSLSRLQTLSISANCIFGRIEFYSTLSTLPLVDLTFFDSPHLSGIGVSSLVEGPSRIATLRQLKLDHVAAKEGTFVRSQEDTDWDLPIWIDWVSRGELEAVREAGKRVGIEVTGTAFEAMEIKERFEEIVASL